MKITFKTSGGIAYFPGLAAPKTIDVDALPGERRQAVEELVHASGFFELPARPSAGGGADYQTYTIEIADGDRRHTVTVRDPVPAALAPLVTLLRELTSR